MPRRNWFFSQEILAKRGFLDYKGNRSKIEKLKSDKDHQSCQQYEQYLGGEEKHTDRTDPDDQQDEAEQFGFPLSPAAHLFK